MPRGYRKDGTPLGRPKGAHGPGWGGAERGISGAPKAERAPPFEPGNQAGVGFGQEKSDGKAAAQQAREIIESRVVRAAEVWAKCLDDPDRAFAAASKIIEQVLSKAPVQVEANVKTRAADGAKPFADFLAEWKPQAE